MSFIKMKTLLLISASLFIQLSEANITRAFVGLASGQTSNHADDSARAFDISPRSFNIRADVLDDAAATFDNGSRLNDEARPVKLNADLQLWESLALSNNPELKKTLRSAEAAAYRSPQAAAMPEPRIRYSTMFDNLGSFGSPMEQKIAVEQIIPVRGVLPRNAELTELEAQRLYLQAELVKRRVLYQVAEAFADYALITASMARLKASIELLDDMTAALNAAVSTGRATTAALIDVEMERDTLKVELETLRSQLLPLAAGINALLGLEPGTAIDSEGCTDCADWLDEGQLLPSGIDGVEWNASLFPEVKTSGKKHQMAQTRGDIAELRRRPSYMVGLEWTFDDNKGGMGSTGSGPMMLMVGMNLPIRRQAIQAGISEAETALEAAEANIREQELRYDSRLSQAMFSYRDAQRRVAGRVEQLYHGVEGMQVAKGEPLYSLYSPELVSAQEEYLALLKSGSRRAGALSAIRERLLQWGISPTQVEQLQREGQAESAMTIMSPYSGIITSLDIREGDYIREGRQWFM